MFCNALRMSTAALVAFAALPAYFAPAGPAPGPQDQDGLQQFGEIDRQPVLIYDVSGSTLLGPVQSTVIVWSDGAVTFSEQDPFTDPVVGVTHVTPKVLVTLMSSLEDAGAHTLVDQWPEVADVPLHTVTILDPATNATAHTFSYWIRSGEYHALDIVLDRLMGHVHALMGAR